MGCKDIGIRKSKFVAKTQFLLVETAWGLDNVKVKRMWLANFVYLKVSSYGFILDILNGP